MTDMDIPTTIKNQDLVKKRRSQIVRAATRLFSKKGFHKTTIRELAREAGLSQGAIYDYVQSKEDILLMNHQIFAEKSSEILKQGFENIDDPLEKLRRLIRAEVKMMDQWAEFLWMGYREYRHLPREQLRMVLGHERRHLDFIESVIEEGVRSGRLAPCNVRVVTHFIKVLAETWVLKQWDLRGHADLSEVEDELIRLVFQGLPAENRSGQAAWPDRSSLAGRTALVINGGTPLAMSLVSYLAARGARLSVYLEAGSEAWPAPPAAPEIRFFSEANDGPLDAGLLRRMASDPGQIDICVHDLGIGAFRPPSGEPERVQVGRRLENNLGRAQDLADVLPDIFPGQGSGRLIYLAPWAWDRLADPVRYETVKSAVTTLTEIMARAMAPSNCTANGIQPGRIRVAGLPALDDSPASFGTAGDVAHALQYLADESAGYLTGQVLRVAADPGSGGV
ncbi:MAG: SDR family oxidoreductase [Proteobacteria bacterium]|nr:SDR family oxidoreductase [Pseudomonadota bacterium]